MDTSMQHRVRREIEALHEFFVGWFTGTVPATDDEFDQGFLRRLDQEFCLIPPKGVVLDRAALAHSVRNSHASNPRFRIAIRNVRVRREFDGHLLATYEEWQRHALASRPPDNSRAATVVFRNGVTLTWLHVHETWLPKEIMEAGPFDF